jgi:hypothetical protein
MPIIQILDDRHLTYLYFYEISRGDSFAFSPKAKINVRLGQALAGGARPRRI